MSSQEPPRSEAELVRKELKSVREDVGRLANAVVTLGSDERLEKAVQSVAEEENRHRQRMLATILVPLIAVAVLGGLNLDSSKDNGQLLDDTKVVADYVRDCLKNRESLTPEQAKAKCGVEEGNGALKFATALISFQRCALQILPADRTDTKMDECQNKAIASLQGS